MQEFKYIIKSKAGLHTRCAGLMAQHAKAYRGTIVSVSSNGQTAKTTQLMRLLSMDFTCGREVTVSAEGPQETYAIADMRKFFAYYL